MPPKLIKPFLVLLAVFAIFIAGLWIGTGGIVVSRGPAGGNAAMLKSAHALSELATVKYVMEKVIPYERRIKVPGNSKEFTIEKLLLVALCEVRAGIDLKKLTANDIRITGTSISLHLPPPEIFSVQLVENQTYVYDRSKWYFVPADKDLETYARRAAVDAFADAALGVGEKGGAVRKGILAEAEPRARALVSALFENSGFATVAFH